MTQIYYGTYNTAREATKAGIRMMRKSGLSFRITRYTIGVYNPRIVYKLYLRK